MAQLTDPRSRHRLDEHLDDAAAVLRLDDRRRQMAEGAADELDKWIRASPELQRFSPILYPQGSFLIRTTVRPRRNGKDADEFDLDMVVELTGGWAGTPDALFDLLWRRLRAHPKYGCYAEKKRRCICIDFPGEFHLDVLPARPDEDRRLNGHETAIEVPDRKLHDWKESDPKGFAAWFEGCSRRRVEAQLVLAHRSILPEDLQVGLDVLRRSVQLTKRHRDVRFNGHDDAPRSIVLTTLMSEHYRGEQSTYLALRGAVGRVEEWAYGATSVPVVRNPVNEEENFAEAWTDESFGRFKRFIRGFHLALAELDQAHGPVEIRKRLALLFDEGTAVAAMKRYGERRGGEFARGNAMYEPKDKARIVGPSAVAAATTAARAVPGGINFGD